MPRFTVTENTLVTGTETTIYESPLSMTEIAQAIVIAGDADSVNEVTDNQIAQWLAEKAERTDSIFNATGIVERFDLSVH